MKVRWTKTSVRCRITPTELTSLENGHPIEESFALSVAWRAQILPASDKARLEAREGVVRIHLTAEEVTRLASPEHEGVYFQTETEPLVRYYIEKDFPCAHPRPAESADPATETFPPDGLRTV
jgi:hypothetical protein